MRNDTVLMLISICFLLSGAGFMLMFSSAYGMVHAESSESATLNYIIAMILTPLSAGLFAVGLICMTETSIKLNKGKWKGSSDAKW